MWWGRCSVVYSEIDWRSFMKARLWKSKLVSGTCRGCVDQGYTLAQVVLKRLEVQNNTYLCFVDLKKAYDSVWKEGLFRRMVDDGVPGKLLSLVKRRSQNVTVRVRVNDMESDWFESKEV